MRRKKRLKQVKLKGPLLYVRNLDRIGISNIDVYRLCGQHGGNGTCLHAKSLQSCPTFDSETSYLCWVRGAEWGGKERGGNTPLSGGGVGSRTQGPGRIA